jgi:hypothetical protein
MVLNNGELLIQVALYADSSSHKMYVCIALLLISLLLTRCILVRLWYAMLLLANIYLFMFKWCVKL